MVKSVGMAGVGLPTSRGAAKGEASYYRTSGAGKVIEQRLPARINAPGLELEDYPCTMQLQSLETMDSNVRYHLCFVSCRIDAGLLVSSWSAPRSGFKVRP